MTDKEFELELERRFDRLYRERDAAWKSYKEAEKLEKDLTAKLYAVAAILHGEHAQHFINGYPVKGRPHLKEKG